MESIDFWIEAGDWIEDQLAISLQRSIFNRQL
jgi:hypothetical protein